MVRRAGIEPATLGLEDQLRVPPATTIGNNVAVLAVSRGLVPGARWSSSAPDAAQFPHKLVRRGNFERRPSKLGSVIAPPGMSRTYWGVSFALGWRWLQERWC